MKFLYRFGTIVLAAALLSGCAANGETPAMQIAKAQVSAAPQITGAPQPTQTPQPTPEPAASPVPTPTEAPTAAPEAPAADTAEEGVPENDEPQTAAGEENAETVDVDLTQMSSTMIYAEVLNMVITPEDYVGKTIKMRGKMAVYEANPALGFDYFFAVVIPDATACCAQGINFVWDGHDTPDTLPAADTEVTVTGVYAAYDIDGWTDYHLQAQSVVRDSE